jgi:hypothetical protein
MEAVCSSETLVDFQRTTRRYAPEGGTLQDEIKSREAFLRWETLPSAYDVLVEVLGGTRAHDLR